jgi:hypothetical protein
MNPGEVGALLILATIPEESRLFKIAPSTTAGTILKSHIQPTTSTTSPPMIPIAVECVTITSALKTPGVVGRKFVRLKTHGIPLQVENGPSASATFRLPTPTGPPMATGAPSTTNVKADLIGGRKEERDGIGTMGAARVGGQTTRGSPDKVVTLIVNMPIGSVEIFKTTALNEVRKTGHGSPLRRGNPRLGAVGVDKVSAIRTTDVTRIETGAAEEAKKAVTITNKDGISDLTIVI